jgi:hypothetical protein
VPGAQSLVRLDLYPGPRRGRRLAGSARVIAPRWPQPRPRRRHQSVSSCASTSQ